MGSHFGTDETKGDRRDTGASRARDALARAEPPDASTTPRNDPAAAPLAARARTAFGRLSGVLSDVANTADVVVRARCPHRGVRSRCFYLHACRNQVTVEGRAVCGGDAAVRFEPVERPKPPGSHRASAGRGGRESQLKCDP